MPSWRRPAAAPPPRENALIESLPMPLRRDLERDLVSIELPLHEVLDRTRPGTLVFPRSCVISVVTTLADGQTVENAVVGREGVWVSSTVLNQTQGLIQVAGAALALSPELGAKYRASQELQDAIKASADRIFMFSCQSCACQVFHTAEQRLARWLLEMRDRVEGDELPLTQEFIASMLGVQRPTVTLAARILQAAEMIRYRHGRITILDRQALQDAACECYNMLARPWETSAGHVS
jgi:hypothetical protein